jgi:hypothetical protein
MKKNFQWIMIMAILWSCNGSPNNGSSANEGNSGVQAGHAETAIMGIYAGAQPCADCDRIHTMISLIENNKGWIKELKLGKSPEERRTIEGTWKIESDDLVFEATDHSYAKKFHIESDSSLTLVDDMCRPDSKPKTCSFKKIKDYQTHLHNDSIVSASESALRNVMQHKRDSIQQARNEKNEEARNKAKLDAQIRAESDKVKMDEKRKKMESKLKKP